MAPTLLAPDLASTFLSRDITQVFIQLMSHVAEVTSDEMDLGSSHLSAHRSSASHFVDSSTLRTGRSSRHSTAEAFGIEFDEGLEDVDFDSNDRDCESGGMSSISGSPAPNLNTTEALIFIPGTGQSQTATSKLLLLF